MSLRVESLPVDSESQLKALPRSTAPDPLSDQGDIATTDKGIYPLENPYYRELTIITPQRKLSALEQLADLTQVPKNISQRSKEIGNFGPAMAATVTQENKAHKELNLFEALFGRDSLQQALTLYNRHPQLLKSTILTLSQFQADHYNPKQEAEPGKIPHEVRPDGDPIRQELTKNSGWEWPYYGSVDATIMFIKGITTITKDDPTFLSTPSFPDSPDSKTVRDSLDAAINWVIMKQDQNEQGFVEYKPSFDGSIDNQVWKDSHDSYHHKDSTLANHKDGIASIEVQTMTLDALIASAELYEQLENDEKAQELRIRADNLRQNILEHMWIDDGDSGFFALGTDRDDQGNPRPMAIKTSNMGYVLGTHLFDGLDNRDYYLQSTIKHLFSDEMLAAGGVRTLASDEIRYHPGAYHNGSVWPFDTGNIAEGLVQEGYYGLSWDYKHRILNTAASHNMLPEKIRGNQTGIPQLTMHVNQVCDIDSRRTHNLEQPPQLIQGWTDAEVVRIKYQIGDIFRNNKNALPLHATDPEKRQFEDEILSHILQPEGVLFDLQDQRNGNEIDQAADD